MAWSTAAIVAMVRYERLRPPLKPTMKRMLLMASSLLMSSSCGGSDKPAAVSSLVRVLEAASSGRAQHCLGRSAEAELARRQLEWQLRRSSREGGDKPAAVSSSLNDSTSPFTSTAVVAPSILPETGGHRASRPQPPLLLPVLPELGGLRAPVSSLASLSARLCSGGPEELGDINPNNGDVVLLVGSAGGGEGVGGHKRRLGAAAVKARAADLVAPPTGGPAVTTMVGGDGGRQVRRRCPLEGQIRRSRGQLW
uniref:Uncharacterized protein n=1 Tax=Oryza barthii TaxID=65489 RepID=A0A0D3HMS9_9ORYZ